MTSLLGEPFAQAGFNFFLRHCAVQAGVFKPASNLVKNIQVVLDVLDGAVVRKLIQQKFDVLLGRAHDRKHSTDWDRITRVAFDRHIVEAQLTLDLIGSSDMPKIAWDALEAGLDGKHIRRLAALDSPTYFQVIDVLPQAMQEMGLTKLDRGEAALRLAKSRAKEILENGEDPLKHTRDFERLWIDAGYPRELQAVGNLDDEVYIASGGQPDEKIRKWVIDRLTEFIND